MSNGEDGHRRRYFHERAKVDAQAGNPIHEGVSQEARSRLLREIRRIAWRPLPYPRHEQMFPYFNVIESRVYTVFGPGKGRGNFDARALSMPVEQFLGVLEIALDVLWDYHVEVSDLLVLQSILADDLCVYRIRFVDKGDIQEWHVAKIDNAHLRSEVVDRTFELTRLAEFAASQRDYTEAWTHFAKGDFDDALVNAHKAFESAAKSIVKLVDADSTPENMQTNQLVPRLVELDIIPSRLQPMVSALRQIFMNAGTLRNAPGTGHGSVNLVGPEASIALLGLRISGSLICFMAERWNQMSST